MLETIRSFIAFDLDNQAILSHLSEVQDTLVNTGASLKLVKPKNIHITVRFLGNVALSMVDTIYEEMKQVSFVPFEVEIRGLGAFPNLQYVRVIWAGIQKGADELRDIFSQLEPRLRKLGFKPDSKGFNPHLTIVRVRTGKNKAELTQRIKELESYKFGTEKACSIKLKKSVLTPKGPIYSTLREVGALKG
jgi:2'-5' RNA ligase